MDATFDGISISAIASALPSQLLEMKDFYQKFGELEVKRIVQSTGIEAVRIAGNLSTGDLCFSAANSMFSALDIDPTTIDALVLVTQTPDNAMPATSAVLQKRLGLRRDVVAMDINYGCSGYIYGLYQAAMLVSSGGCKRVLLATGDVISKLLHPDDHHVRMVFGDAASVTLVEQGNGKLDVSIRTDGGGAKHIQTPVNYQHDEGGAARIGHLHMQGTAVMNFALEQVPDAIKEFLNKRKMQYSDVSLFLLHQANQFMLQYLARRIGVNESKVPIQLRHVGNTGPSSIPLTVSLGSDSNFFQRDNIVVCGFGVGLSVGVARLSLAQTSVVAPVYLDPHTETSQDHISRI